MFAPNYKTHLPKWTRITILLLHYTCGWAVALIYLVTEWEDFSTKTKGLLLYTAITVFIKTTSMLVRSLEGMDTLIFRQELSGVWPKKLLHSLALDDVVED